MTSQQHSRGISTVSDPQITFIPHWNVMLLDMTRLHVRTSDDVQYLDTFVRRKLQEFVQNQGNEGDDREERDHQSPLLTCLVNYDEFLVDDEVVTEYADWVRKICCEKYSHVVRFSLKVKCQTLTTSVQVANWRDQSKSMIPGYLNKLQQELSRMHVRGEHIFSEGDRLDGKHGSYLLTGKLSQGTFGLVRSAHVLPVSPMKSSFRDANVAIKCMLRSTIELLDMKEFIEQEIQIMYKLQGCKNVVQIVEDVHSEETIFIVMEMLNSKGSNHISLCHLEDTRERLDEDEARSLFRQLSRGIEEMHDRHIIHRDLQPSNLCFDRFTGQLKVIDFGASTWSIHPDTKESMKHTLLCGNIRYCSPEMISRQEYGPETDIFSAGVILFKLLTGYHPFWFARDKLEGQFSLTMEPCPESDGMVAIRDGHIEDNDTICVSSECHDFLLWLLAGDPTERPSIKQVLDHPWLSHGQEEEAKVES